MPKNIVFIHSAGPQGETDGSSPLIQYVKEHLGNDYEVIYPAMPNPMNPKYLDWQRTFETEIEKVKGEVLLVGHSMGGAFLIKYLSEETFPLPLKGVYVIAAPFWGLDNEWQRCTDFFLQEGFEQKLVEMEEIILYHSYNEEVVPFSHHEQYARKITTALTRELNSKEHLFLNGLPELVQDIKKS